MFERCLYFNVNALARIVNKQWNKAFAEFDLSPSHGYLLRVVLAEPSITQKNLAKELKLEKSTITRFVDTLQRKELIIRKKISNDGREHHIYPTNKALKIQSVLESKGNELYQKMVSTIGQEQLTSLVGQLRQNAKKLSQ
ncbi:MAG: MarR family transcriptional regulator [Proteobacteria bacterium]|nr:MarR family transcriptional regulator [Pseudomonadota bacterium]